VVAISEQSVQFYGGDHGDIILTLDCMWAKFFESDSQLWRIQLTVRLNLAN